MYRNLQICGYYLHNILYLCFFLLVCVQVFTCVDVLCMPQSVWVSPCSLKNLCADLEYDNVQSYTSVYCMFLFFYIIQAFLLLFAYKLFFVKLYRLLKTCNFALSCVLLIIARKFTYECECSHAHAQRNTCFSVHTLI